jgi:hypothetical protein
MGPIPEGKNSFIRGKIRSKTTEFNLCKVFISLFLYYSFFLLIRAKFAHQYRIRRIRKFLYLLDYSIIQQKKYKKPEFYYAVTSLLPVLFVFED